MGHGEAAAAVRKLTFVSGIHTSPFTLLPAMFPSYIFPENATVLLLYHKRLTSGCWCVVDVYVSLCLRDSNCTRKTESGGA